jgi:hypothetical protein
MKYLIKVLCKVKHPKMVKIARRRSLAGPQERPPGAVQCDPAASEGRGLGPSTASDLL